MLKCEKARKHICVTDRHDMTLAVKVALNSNTTNQPTMPKWALKELKDKIIKMGTKQAQADTV